MVRRVTELHSEEGPELHSEEPVRLEAGSWGPCRERLGGEPLLSYLPWISPES